MASKAVKIDPNSNIKVNNVDDKINSKEFFNMFYPYGKIESCRLMTDPNTQ